MTDDEKVFIDVCELLDKNGINFWICHGTLLGIIREDRLLPWDHDIDSAVWHKDVSRQKILNIFLENGYKQELVFGDVDCMHFFGKNKKIDVSFYKIKDNIASIRWVAPSKSFVSKFYLHVVQIIWEDSIRNIQLSKKIIKRSIQYFLILILSPFKLILTSSMKKRIYENSIKYMNHTGYSYPLNLMNFKKISFRGRLVQVPIRSDLCLEMTYGVGWKKPNENYIWHEEANNLIHQ